jgi:hypothetical protein
MPKPINLPPEVARAFAADMRAFHAEKDAAKRDAIVASQTRYLNEHVATKVRTHEVKAMFHAMKDHA